MQINNLQPIDLIDHAKAVLAAYSNTVLTSVNDHVIRLSVMTEPFYWHAHPNSDEIFLGVEGSLIIELEETSVELLPGQLFTVRKNIKHRTRPNGSRSVNLTVEKNDIETVKLEE